MEIWGSGLRMWGVGFEPEEMLVQTKMDTISSSRGRSDESEFEGFFYEPEFEVFAARDRPCPSRTDGIVRSSVSDVVSVRIPEHPRPTRNVSF